MREKPLTFMENLRTFILLFPETSSNQGKITMFAVVDIAGQQLKVSPNERLYVPKLENEAGATVTFGRVLLVVDDSGVTVGNPYVSSMSVGAKVLGHVKDEKVIVFKKKKRKGYRTRRGHRQQYTEIEITNIG
jgi:large subunit ribosomal protein L21